MLRQPISTGMRQPQAAICSVGMRLLTSTPRSEAKITATCWLATRNRSRDGRGERDGESADCHQPESEDQPCPAALAVDVGAENEPPSSRIRNPAAKVPSESIRG
jgi:hypothetical protein